MPACRAAGQRSRCRPAEVADRDVLGGAELVGHVVLEHHADPVAELGRVQVAQVGAVPQDPAAIGVVEPAQQLDQRALAGAVVPDERDRLAVRDEAADPAQHPRLVRAVPEPHVVDLDPPAQAAAGAGRSGTGRSGGGDSHLAVRSNISSAWYVNAALLITLLSAAPPPRARRRTSTRHRRSAARPRRPTPAHSRPPAATSAPMHGQRRLADEHPPVDLGRRSLHLGQLVEHPAAEERAEPEQPDLLGRGQAGEQARVEELPPLGVGDPAA